MIRFKVKNERVTMSVVSLRESVTMKVATLPLVNMTVASAIRVGVSGHVYKGSYEATPSVNEQTMNTQDKYMSEDVTIRSIPYYSVGNNSGGNTVYIASEV